MSDRITFHMLQRVRLACGGPDSLQQCFFAEVGPRIHCGLTQFEGELSVSSVCLLSWGQCFTY